MKKTRTLSTIGLEALACALLLVVAGGCGRAKPKPICTMENPETKQRVEMFREISFKVPADYDEKKHIEWWKAEQRKKGFTVEIREDNATRQAAPVK
jgi:alpha-L-fucosidase